MSNSCDLTHYTDFHRSATKLEAESPIAVGLVGADSIPVTLFIFTGTAQVEHPSQPGQCHVARRD